MDLTLVALAAGLSTRYRGVKQLEPVGPGGATLLDYAIYDALRAGFSQLVVVTRRELERAFREQLGRTFSGSLSVRFASQELAALPEGFAVPTARRKPWGTGHAVLCAAGEVEGPFVAMNADDFYGADAYASLAGHLRGRSGSGRLDFAAAAYRLRDTLSPFGGVSRGVCEVDEHGYLRRVTEVRQIKREAGVIAGVTVAGERVELTGDETISMNIWAATPAAFPLLQERFVRFLGRYGADPEAEFLLSTAVNDLIEAGELRVRVIPASGPWLGVTYREDRAYVERRIRELVSAGIYPEDLSRAAGGGGRSFPDSG